MCLGELMNAYFCHLQRVYEVGIQMHLRAKRSREAAAAARQIGALAATDIRATSGSPLRPIALDAPLDEHEALQLGLGRVLATAHAAPRRDRYEDASASDGASASSSGTSTGDVTASAPASATIDASGSAASASGAISSVGCSASAWWESSPQ